MLRPVLLLVVLLASVDCELYSYGVDVEDNNLMRSGTDPVLLTIPHHVQYLGTNYNQIYISKIGVLGFSNEIYFIEQQWRSNPEEANNPFIAPYYFETANANSNTGIPGSIFYRVDQNETFLGNLADYLKTSVVGGQVVENFNFSFAVVVTWVDVVDVDATTAGCVDEGGDNICNEKNTFQLVLVASRTQTFAIFNYEKMQVPVKANYQAGMNGGFNRGWTDVYCGNNCNNIDYNSLPTVTGSDIMGKFVFKVSDVTIVRGGCLPQSLGTGKLEIFPKSVGTFGGEMIDVSGLCLTPTTQIKCKYGVVEAVDGYYINIMVARCLTPRLTARGVVKLEILLDGAATGFSTELNVALPGRSYRNIYLSDGWNETDYDRLGVKWDAEFLSEDPEARVDVELIGYRETKDEVIWKKLLTLGINILNSAGTHSFIPSEFRCSGDDCHLFEIGQVEVRLRTQYITNKNKYGYFGYYVQPLGWYVVDYMKDKLGEDWSRVKCVDWYKTDKQEMGWEEELLDCPCTLTQEFFPGWICSSCDETRQNHWALIREDLGWDTIDVLRGIALTDFGRWQPDGGCSIFSGSVCTYHIGAVHCVRAFLPTLSSGSGNQCCYGPDGNVRYAADSYQGSTPDRSHDWGAAPYNKPDHIPSLSHWKHDVVTFYYCCLWVEYDYCDYYMDQRATRDCKNYHPPQTATVFGDPHVITFNGFYYHTVARGDYWLIKTDKFKLQARFDQVSTETAGVTGLIGISLQGEGTSKVEVRLTSPANRSHTRELTVLVDNEIKLFDTKASGWQDLKGLSIINTESSVGLHDNFTIVINAGIGIQIANKHGLLRLLAVLPESYKETSRGLLGSWSESENNKLRLPDESLIDNDISGEQLHSQFVSKWQVEATGTLFKFTQRAASFAPNYAMSPISNIAETLFCGDNSACKYDYQFTGSKVIAVETKMAEEAFREIQSFQIAVGSCGLLDVPRSFKSNVNYSIGSSIELTGCKTGSLLGTTEYMCSTNDDGSSTWKPEVNAECKASLPGPVPTQENLGVSINQKSIFGIIVAIMLLLML